MEILPAVVVNPPALIDESAADVAEAHAINLNVEQLYSCYTHNISNKFDIR